MRLYPLLIISPNAGRQRDGIQILQWGRHGRPGYPHRSAQAQPSARQCLRARNPAGDGSGGSGSCRHWTISSSSPYFDLRALFRLVTAVGTGAHGLRGSCFPGETRYMGGAMVGRGRSYWSFPTLESGNPGGCQVFVESQKAIFRLQSNWARKYGRYSLAMKKLIVKNR